MVAGVDMGFMSTSRSCDTPIQYMTHRHSNVLWELSPRPPTDSAFHCGADISMLSQYQQEDEVLFPPCTMLQVQRRRETAPREALREAREGWESAVDNDKVPRWLDVSAHASTAARNRKKEFIRVSVVPNFL